MSWTLEAMLIPQVTNCGNDISVTHLTYQRFLTLPNKSDFLSSLFGSSLPVLSALLTLSRVSDKDLDGTKLS